MSIKDTVMAEEMFGKKLMDTIPPSDNWRRVEDELPRNSRAVLTFGSHASPVVGFYNDIWKKWFSYVDREGDDGYMDEVTHWMPLPKPPVEV